MSRALGNWGSVFKWPLIGIHTILTPDNKILTFGTDKQGKQSGLLYYDVWDPKTKAHFTLDNVTEVDMFCAVAMVIPATGKIMIAGGDARPFGDVNYGVTSVNHYDYRDKSLVKAPDGEDDMAFPRWYPTAVTLANGTILVLGGKGAKHHGGDGASPYPELYTPDVGWKTLDGAADPAFEKNWFYPRAWLKSNGDVIVYGADGNKGKGVYKLDPTGDGDVQQIGSLPFLAKPSTPAIMFAPDKVLALATGGGLWQIDFSGASPQFASVGSVGQARYQSSMTVLADGSVMISGGSAVNNKLSGIAKKVAIWDPDTHQVTFGDLAAKARLYHSTAIMLPDASVLTLGGGAPGPLTNLNGEIYKPGYLYKVGGGLAPRPAITNAPQSIAPEGTFQIKVDDASDIDRLTFVKNGAVTHTFNMDTRFVELPFTVGANNTLTVNSPDNANLLAPGNWMLFAIDDKGVPSHAKTIKVEIGGQVMVAAQGYATLAGDAFATPGGGFKLKTGPAGNPGAALFNETVDLSRDVSFAFDVKLAYCGCEDGVTFLLHADPHGESAPAEVIEAGGLRLSIGALDGADHDHGDDDDHDDDHEGDPGHGHAATAHDDGHDDDGEGEHPGGHATDWRLTPAAERELAEFIWHRVQVFWDASRQSLSYTIDGAFAGELTGEVLDAYLGGATEATFGFVGARLLDGEDCHEARLIAVREGRHASMILRGDGGDDRIRGGDGDDALYGAGGGDILRGLAGDDTLRPGLGADWMQGGTGADTFVLRSPAEAAGDTILLFERGRDTIDVSAIDADRTEPGNQAFAWLGSGRFGDDPGGLRLADGRLLGDLDGDGAADLVLKLPGVSAMAATDFLL
jgi:hypothetical protein